MAWRQGTMLALACAAMTEAFVMNGGRMAMMKTGASSALCKIPSSQPSRLAACKPSALAGPAKDDLVLASSSSLKYESRLPAFRQAVTSLKASSDSAGTKKAGRLLLGFYFFAWYVLNVGYNIVVKKTLNICPLPWTFAVIQLGAGILWLAPQWLSGIRAIPKPSEENLKALTKVAVFHGFGQLATVTAMGLGSVSFVNVVKALEPICTALIGLIVTGRNLPWQVWLSMLPVVGGVGLASASELSFTWGCFLAAMFSNVVYATRGVLSKESMEMSNPGENMTAENTYAVVTLIAFVLMLPFALFLEGSKVASGLAMALDAVSPLKLAQMVVATGLLYYTYNEMAFLVLGSVAPVTQSVGNTVKRVVVIVAAAIVFQTPMTPLGIIGSSTAILGVLLYSVIKGRFPDKPKKD
ncbi:hypothetical protein GUITHDRAFT_155603, partial [Guillardia theta CCMP2712]